MLRSLKEIIEYNVLAEDGEIGKAQDLLFDDQQWCIRYLIVDTGKWLPGRKVLLSPATLRSPDWESHLFPVTLTKKQVQESPPLSVAEPVSRQHEVKLHDHFGWRPYWLSRVPGTIPPSPMHTGGGPTDKMTKEAKPIKESSDDPHLRSLKEVIGYHIKATDGEIGHVEDFIGDDDLWVVRYFVIDTQNFLPGKRILLPPLWAKEISWQESYIAMDVSQEKIRNAPEFDPSQQVHRQYEELLYDYYGRPHGWA